MNALPNLRREPRGPQIRRAALLQGNRPDPDMIYAAMVDALAARRIALKISQSELDQLCGFASGQIGKWECGERRPNAYNLCVWASALNTVLAVAPLDSPSRSAIASRAPWRQTTEAA